MDRFRPPSHTSAHAEAHRSSGETTVWNPRSRIRVPISVAANTSPPGLSKNTVPFDDASMILSLKVFSSPDFSVPETRINVTSLGPDSISIVAASAPQRTLKNTTRDSELAHGGLPQNRQTLIPTTSKHRFGAAYNPPGRIGR